MKSLKSLKKSVVMIFAVGLCCSCASSSKTASIDVDYVAKGGFLMAKPLVADISIEKRKITGRSTIQNRLYGQEKALEAARSLAVIDAVKRGDADLIVQPVYEIESNSTETTAIVTGYAGKYKEFRAVKTTDTLAFKMRSIMEAYANELEVPRQITVEKAKK